MIETLRISGRLGARAAAMLFTALTLNACARQNPQADVDRLMQTSREWSRAAEQRDVERVMSYWADDAILIIPGEPMRRGRAAIRDYIERGFGTDGFSVSWTPIEARLSPDGQMGYLIERSHATSTGTDGQPVTQDYQALTIWRKDREGRWRNVVDMSTPAMRQP